MAKAKTAPLDIENELIIAGHSVIAGVDEVGRGAWAGPIMAGAAIMPLNNIIEGVRDSKKMTPARREKMALEIAEIAVALGIGTVTCQEIDEMGIGPANELAIRRAIDSLSIQPDYILIDAFPVDNLVAPSRSIIRGDSASYSIAAASIYAKVTRDTLMKEYGEEFPEYQFSAHVGYGTADHRAALDAHGICAIHRRSFQPMASMI